MKTRNIFAALAVAVVSFSSCNKDEAKDGANETGPIDLKLELVANLQEKKAEAKPGGASVLAVLDVKSYNAKTGEIAFNSPKLPENIGEWRDNGYKVDVYLNSETRLFSVDFVSSLFSSEYKSPVLYYSLIDASEIPDAATEKDKWYILSGYPHGKVLTSETITNGKQLESFKKIETSWNTFVDALKKSGKYVD